ncbi:MAG TPA: Calx-beta domain-containing protein [Candidatus Saccharimonadales bacterium]|nr:Calx-beta domain-containing protein [Candidatus Saccharimonadales bacterium]
MRFSGMKLGLAVLTLALLHVNLRAQIVVDPVPIPPRTIVSVAATDPDATEIPVVPPGMEMPQRWDPAIFTFSRTGDTGFPVTVYYSLGGTAQNGVDYDKLTGAVTIPAGALTADVIVSPIDDLLVEGTESVEIAIQPVVCAAIFPPPPGCYQIGAPAHALAFIHDNDTETRTNQPPFVRLISPREGSIFRAPAHILLQAGAGDSNGSVTSVVFFANSQKIGHTDLPSPLAVANTSLLYAFAWSNVVAGKYALTAQAFDNGGASTLSAPVNISVVTELPPPTNRLPIVTITAPDAFAAEGTNRQANIVGGSPNTATFIVHRAGPTNSSIVVFYAVGGSASNGVDYLKLPGTVTIPAGERSARITISPIDDSIPEPTESVIVGLTPSPMASLPTYDIGFPGKAGAVIVDNDGLILPTCRLGDGLFHLCIQRTNGFPYRLECSPDMINWIPICTSVVVDGAVHFVEPDTDSAPHRFYRILPELNATPE